MSDFENLFPSFSTTTAYTTVLDGLLKHDENGSLLLGVANAGTYGFNGAAYTIGYGYDIRAQTGTQIINDFTAAGIFTTENTNNNPANGPVGQYASLVGLLLNYNNGQFSNSTSLGTLNASFTTDFGTNGITEAQASSLLNAIVPRYDATLTSFVNANSAQQGGFTLGNTGLHIFLLSEWYNGGSNVFGPTQASDIATDNVTDFLADVLFFNNTSSGTYLAGLENRRIQDLSTSIGLANPQSLSGTNLLTLNFIGNKYAALYTAQTIADFYTDITAQIGSLGASANNLTALLTSLQQNSETTLAGFGLYVVQPSDTIPSIAAKFGISVAALDNINTVFSDSSSAVGGLLHVPVARQPVPSDGTSLPRLLNGDTYVYDSATQTVYTVGSSLNGQDADALIIDTPTGLGLYPTFAAGTYSGISVTNGNVSVTLSDPNDPGGVVNLGNYGLDPSLTLTDGLTFTLPTLSSINLSDPLPSNAPLDQVLASYLTQLGDPITAAQLDTDNFNYLNQNGSAYVVTGFPAGNNENFSLTSSNPPGAIITGVSGAYNILSVSYIFSVPDISQDTISGIQQLNAPQGVSMTQAEFSSFSVVNGGGAFTATTGGTYNFSTETQQFGNITATDLVGTTLIGGSLTGQRLTASTYGNDTLIAGNGKGDMLAAGEGVDTLTGGTGGDSFIVANGLAAGSVITGNGTGNVLTTGNASTATVDISAATITGVQTLSGDVTLSAAELSGFNTIENAEAVRAGTGGIFDLSSKNIVGSFPNPGGFRTQFIFAAESNGGTTLIGSNVIDGQYIEASTSGNDMLELNGGMWNRMVAGDGNDTLKMSNSSGGYLGAAHTTGNNTLTVSSATGVTDTLYSLFFAFSASSGGEASYVLDVTYSGGNNTLTGDNSADVEMFANYSSGANTLSAGDGALDGAVADNSSGANTLTLGNGNGDYLSAINSTGTNTLIAGNGANDVLNVSGSTGNDTLIGGTGGDTFVAGGGDDSIQGNGGNNTYKITGGTSSTDTINNYHTDDGQSVIDFVSAASTQVVATQSGNDLVLTVGSDPVIVQNYFAGSDYQVASISFTDGVSWTPQNIPLSAICYLAGSHILTPTGEVLVEDLKIGDLVVTRFSGIQPIKWIGRQSYDSRFIRQNRDHIPVCIRAGALADHMPARDLYVSPGHSMLVGGQLVLAWSLVNGITITQDNCPDKIHYFQLELESHDCVIAEGAWSETFADGPGLREQFHNAAEFAELYPDQPMASELSLCALRPEHGPKLDAALRPVVARTAASLTPGPLTGYIDRIEAPWAIVGWAQDADHPELPVLLEVMLGDRVIATTLACDHRQDLQDARIGQGRSAFFLTSPIRLRPEMLPTLRVRRVGDGAEIEMTPECRASIEAMQQTQEAPGLRRVA